MLLHFTPTIYCSVGTGIQLISITIEEIDLTLSANFMVTARRIKSSQRYHLASRTGSLKLSSGILVVSPMELDHYTVVTKWQVGGNRTATHRVLYKLNDRKHSFASDNPRLWYPTSVNKGEWDNMWPDRYSEFSPRHLKPTMFINCADRPIEGMALLSNEVLDNEGRVLELSQEMTIPTLEPGRLTHHPMSSNMPLLDQIFDAPVKFERRKASQALLAE